MLLRKAPTQENYTEALSTAAEHGDMSIVQQLVAHKARGDMLNARGYSSIRVACQNRHADVAHYLLEHSALLEDSIEALSDAVERGDMMIVEIRVEKGARGDLPNSHAAAHQFMSPISANKCLLFTFCWRAQTFQTIVQKRSIWLPNIEMR